MQQVQLSKSAHLTMGRLATMNDSNEVRSNGYASRHSEVFAQRFTISPRKKEDRRKEANKVRLSRVGSIEEEGIKGKGEHDPTAATVISKFAQGERFCPRFCPHENT